MQSTITIKTDSRETLVDITKQVQKIVKDSKVKEGVCSVYAQGATSAIMIQENWDDSVQQDVINYLKKQIPQGVWKHDAQDNNADAHIKSGLVGPSETIPIINNKLGLSQWQNIFFCEFDGPRDDRTVIVNVLGS